MNKLFQKKLTMKRILLMTTVFITLLVSCTKNSSVNPNERTKLSKENSVTEDTTLFVGKHKAQAMVLGVFHFNPSGSDSYKQEFPFNILEEKRQRELDQLLDKIAIYKPTKILLEWNRIKDDSITNISYQKFLQNDFDISNKPNEVYQIGFKLAKRLGHEKIYCSDAQKVWYGIELDWENYDEEGYLKSKGQYEKSIRYNYSSFYKLGDSLKSVQPLVEHLAWKNKLSNRLKSHQIYLTSIIEGAGDNYLGADNTGSQYSRNLRIFSNVYDLTNFNQEERILLIFGASHVWQLRQFFIDSPDYNYVEPTKYLN